MTQFIVQHKKSNQLEGSSKPKLPTAEQLTYGEIAINYATDYETISLKNADNAIVSFSSDKAIDTKLQTKQDLLVSGENIKTVNGNSLLGEGNISIDTSIPQASTSTLGGVKTGYSASGKNYAVQVDGSGNAYVNVPWTDTTYTLSSLGISATAQELNYCDGVTSNIQSQLNGKAASSHTHNLNDITNLSTTYLTKTDAAAQYQAKGTYLTSIPQASTSTLGGIKAGYTTSGKNYAVQVDGSGNAYVNVPWTDNNTTYNLVGTSGTTGLIKNGSNVTSASGYVACPIISGIPYYKDTNSTTKLYVGTGSTANTATTNGNTKLTLADDTSVRSNVTIKGGGATTVSSDANGIITVTSTDTKYSLPIASTALGGIKTDYVTSGKNYAVKVESDGSAYVNVPWTDTDTHHTTKLSVGTGTTANTATSNGNTKITVSDNNTVRNSITIKGGGATTVSSDASGVITVTSTDTKYTLPNATSSTLGGIRVGHPAGNANEYAVLLNSSQQAYVSLPSIPSSLSSFGVKATSTELNYCDGVTSNIQSQLNGKAASSHTHTVDNLTNKDTLFQSERGSYNNTTLPTSGATSINGSYVYYDTTANETSGYPGAIFSFKCSSSSWKELQFRIPGGGEHTGTVKYRLMRDYTRFDWHTIAALDIPQSWSEYQDFKAGAGNSGSDMRFKEVYSETIGDVLENIQDIKIFPYKWTKEGETNWDTFGVDANQMIEKGGIYEKMVHERPDEDKTKFVDYDRFGLIAIKAIQELTAKVKELEAEIQKLNNELKNK